MDLQGVDVYSHVTLVDRAMQGGCEIWFDHVPLAFEKGQIELTVPLFVAEWLFTASNGDKHKVWTTDGEYVCRFGVKNAPQRLLDLAGPQIADLDPIEIDLGAVEGTDVKLTRTDKTEVRQIRVPRNELTEKQGAGSKAGALVGG